MNPKNNIERSCKICGCTDNNCKNCIDRTGEPCYWVDENLCSACFFDLNKDCSKEQLLLIAFELNQLDEKITQLYNKIKNTDSFFCFGYSRQLKKVENKRDNLKKSYIFLNFE